jgi:hypothetical protein
MKKMVFGLSLALAVFGFLQSPAMAAVPSQVAPSAADLAFLATLAAPAKAPAAPEPAAKRPSGVEKALCSATATCWNGTTVSCEGNNSTTACVGADSSCPNQRGYVTCDGSTTWCPECQSEPEPCPSGWCSHEWECSMSCYPCPYTYTCNETYCTDFCRCNFRNCAP